jgi:hypothetical protein
MTIAANGFRRLQQMLRLRQIGIGIAVVNQRIEIVRGFPDALPASIETEVLLFFAKNVCERLSLVVDAVELGNGWIRFRVILAKLRLRFSFLVTAFQKFVSIVQSWERGW